jgi:hypothetical protein
MSIQILPSVIFKKIADLTFIRYKLLDWIPLNIINWNKIALNPRAIDLIKDNLHNIHIDMDFLLALASNSNPQAILVIKYLVNHNIITTIDAFMCLSINPNIDAINYLSDNLNILDNLNNLDKLSFIVNLATNTNDLAIKLLQSLLDNNPTLNDMLINFADLRKKFESNLIKNSSDLSLDYLITKNIDIVITEFVKNKNPRVFQYLDENWDNFYNKGGFHHMEFFFMHDFTRTQWVYDIMYKRYGLTQDVYNALSASHDPSVIRMLDDNWDKFEKTEDFWYRLAENSTDGAVKLFLKHNLEISSLLNVMWVFSSNPNDIAVDYILDNINNQNVIDIDEDYFWIYLSDNKNPRVLPIIQNNWQLFTSFTYSEELFDNLLKNINIFEFDEKNQKLQKQGFENFFLKKLK